MTPLKSSNLDAADYDHGARKLTVRFKSGATHSYADVAPHHFTNMVKDDSPGGYFAKHIRNAHKSERVDDAK